MLQQKDLKNSQIKRFIFQNADENTGNDSSTKRNDLLTQPIEEKPKVTTCTQQGLVNIVNPGT